ncbi:RNA polymerase sigma factor [Faecalibacterium duncaniae]|uniref:RNA polymerase sigma factor n=1 Tax=Faecalibacterium duncaniae (strain DSM 17677 / JCM 31915 / A2-165) TaxID=411483 RepID=UPI001F618C61|nr:sigma-70 family RNA polymerase sigma factor [Faecalibacterium duncaniae]MDV5055833.1 sigma-70 family RNA polymerase sigma factor [Faecalibacterium duncaniae]
MSDCQKHPDDTYRRQKRELPPLDDTLTDVPSPAPLPGEELEQLEGALSLYQKLHALPEPYREVFWLRVYGELTFAEIAALHHKTESWARVTFYRARMKMKEAIL